MTIPAKIPYLIIGAGVHGLSTAWHLARALKARGQRGSDVLVIDKTGPGAGSSGIACGVVHDGYYQPAMGEIMRLSVGVWESDPAAFAYHGVGYLMAVAAKHAPNLTTIHQRQRNSGYPSTLIQGEAEVTQYMQTIFPDWQAQGLTAVLHEHRGGFAYNREAVRGLARKAEAAGVTIRSGVKVTSFAQSDETVTAVHTNQGPIKAQQIVIAVGPWIKHVWAMLGLPNEISVNTPARLPQTLPLWTFWQRQEGTINIDSHHLVTAAGKPPPVIHVDSTAPLISDTNGTIITDRQWGIYFKQNKAGLQGGAVPQQIGPHARLDPYGPESGYYVVNDQFIDYWTAGLAHCLARFEGCYTKYRQGNTGGLACFTIDNFPIFDYVLPNVYVMADSGHGYKMIGVGQEVAQVLLGKSSQILHPFRYSRFQSGDLHPASSSPFPWL